MHAAEDAGRADALRDAREARVDESHDTTATRACLAHNGRLGARVHEGLEVVAVDGHGYVEHVHGPEGLGSVLHRQLHVLLHVLQTDLLFDLLLQLHVEGILLKPPIHLGHAGLVSAPRGDCTVEVRR